ncbi:hypothetical protein CAP39_06120 [Sphingomonas sp. IBVSS1]|nr:hypothetical protein CAP39_06120 [Sphingomonas sp. IBVSS1]
MKIANGIAFIDNVRALPRETNWVEFKTNNFTVDNAGKYLCALANSAILEERDEAYLIFGVEDESHEVVGTTLDLASEKVGAEPAVLNICKYISPSMAIHHETIDYHGKRIEVLCIKPPYQQPVRWKGQAYVRVAASQQALNNHPDLERSIWQITSRFSFESSIVETNLSFENLREFYSVNNLLKMLGKRVDSPEGAIDHLKSLGLIKMNLEGGIDVRAILGLSCSRDTNRLPMLRDKPVRVITYNGSDKLSAVDDREGTRGYTTTFQSLMQYVMERIPHKEILKHGIRKTEYKIPELTVREFLANAIIHQDLTQTGGRPVVEIYNDKIRIINPGLPLIETDRFIDSPSKSRNPEFAKLMRSAGLCEQRGSGVDRALREIERASLPPPLIQAVEGATIVTIFMNKTFAQLTADERVRACYQHACLQHESGEPMGNGSLRLRFGLGEKQYPQVSNVIADAISAGRIRPLNEGQANRVARYVPYWA